MKIAFTARGHPNITATHRNTFEFTKDSEVTEAGDCIVGVEANFDSVVLKEFVSEVDRGVVVITVDEFSERIEFEVNHNFCDDNEMVFRRGEFASERTIGLRADRVCMDFGDSFRERLKDPDANILVEIESLE